MASPALTRAFDDVRLHVVTGKGGAGKTTVAAALALALAEQGRRVLLCEVEGRQGISQTFDVPPLGDDEVRLVVTPEGGELTGLSVDAKAALLEYLQTFYKLGRAGSALERLGAIDFATTIAPGVRDVLLIGKVYEAAGRTDGARRGQGQRVFDAVVLDAPPTGRVGKFLAVNEEVAGIAKVGPIRSQADSITRLLRDRRTAVHIVTLLEEMPVQESIDAVAELSAAGFGLGCLVVNMVREPLLSDAEMGELAHEDPAALAQRVRADLERAGVRASGPLVEALLDQGRDHAERVALQDGMDAQVVAQGLPVLRLPFLPEGVEGGGVAVLADALAEQGVR